MNFIARQERTFWAAGLCALLFSLPLAGCGGPENVASVRGVVTLDGQPLPDATLEFQPEKGRPSFGKTDEEGYYTLLYTPEHDGAEIGKHQVRISTASESTDPATGEMKTEPEKVPAKYNVKSELTAEVEAGSNEINFDLTSK